MSLEVRVRVSEGAAHVIILAFPGFHQLLELGHDLIPAAVPGVVHPETVVHFLAPVQGQNHVAAFPVGKIDHVVINEHAVGGEGEAEILVVLLLNASCVCDKLFHHIPVHQRLASEEIDFQVAT